MCRLREHFYHVGASEENRNPMLEATKRLKLHHYETNNAVTIFRLPDVKRYQGETANFLLYLLHAITALR